MNLIFMYDHLMTKEYREKLNLPLEFITFAFIEGKMYEYFEHNKHIKIALEKDAIVRNRGNDKIFGAIFALPFYKANIRVLDGIYACSRDRLKYNNPNDIMHRKDVMATPIHFNSIDELSRMLYTRREPIKVQAFYGNPEHNWIKHRVLMQRYRVVDGVDHDSFLDIYKEEG